jgi:hypothetical protein
MSFVEFENSNASSKKVLLVTNVLIRGDEKVKLTLGTLQQIAVLNPTPALVLNR